MNGPCMLHKPTCRPTVPLVPSTGAERPGLPGSVVPAGRAGFSDGVAEQVEFGPLRSSFGSPYGATISM